MQKQISNSINSSKAEIVPLHPDNKFRWKIVKPNDNCDDLRIELSRGPVDLLLDFDDLCELYVGEVEFERLQAELWRRHMRKVITRHRSQGKRHPDDDDDRYWR
ncbi:hypothetical protein [Mesorhizobium sp. M2C.T.Ca.TU.002.02.1.1]|uniref:hypothetical protein n=1 Tax=Mesorhizobium sp. M2C.T.Ca.TU.002.02.1.1 TaxID=2496788 RepID=UPI000FCA5E16|nr:hypothetical protein [Mesorhizobium sp. M2C.T.Ca.TU.002.02.1.1]RUU59449.1 hypothetical protein EOD07_07085 [Mesorhizobium sp. M2C.T.Ca.TU.002.02.1.1]RUU71595.1 hypothetical protein EOD04_02220 [Mesorhizobium sp. M2C.T.Ca.TU.009.01.2.1]